MPVVQKLRRSSRLTRLHAVFAAAALLLFGQLVSLQHDVSTHHEVCAEHGEWIDVDAVDAHAADGERDGDHSHDSGPQAIGTSHPSSHDHCPIVAYAKQSSPRPIHVDGLFRPRGIRLPSTVVDAPRPCSTPRYLLAPKHSPPGAFTLI